MQQQQETVTGQQQIPPGAGGSNVHDLDLSGSEQQDGTKAPDSENESIWDDDTLQSVRNFSDTLTDIKNRREELNAEKTAAQANLINKGFNKDALHEAIKYANTEEDKRQNFDMTYLYARKALGHPVQDDLFTAAMQQQVKVSNPVNNQSEDE
jgi:hypothetical protein